MSETYRIASGFFGDKLYQQRAREALPILVRQAKAATPIYYEDLAAEMGMPNPRNLNYPLGCIGDALNELSKQWGRDIPHIQTIVRNRQTDLPGPGFDGFLEQQGHSWSSAQERRALIQTYLLGRNRKLSLLGSGACRSGIGCYSGQSGCNHSGGF